MFSKLEFQIAFPPENLLALNLNMKSLLSFLFLITFGAIAFADIQSPPMADMGPTRKLGRGFSNLLFGVTELPLTLINVNDQYGNSAAFSYGLTKGIGRFIFRFGVGLYEVITFPAPLEQNSYRPPYRLNIPWKLGGFEEFPPELGFESRYNYCN